MKCGNKRIGKMSQEEWLICQRIKHGSLDRADFEAVWKKEEEHSREGTTGTGTPGGENAACELGMWQRKTAEAAKGFQNHIIMGINEDFLDSSCYTNLHSSHVLKHWSESLIWALNHTLFYLSKTTYPTWVGLSYFWQPSVILVMKSNGNSMNAF